MFEKIELMNIKVDSNDWRVQIHKEIKLPREDDLGFIIWYYKCSNDDIGSFEYKIRFYDVLTTSDDFDIGSDNKMKLKGLAKTKMLLSENKYENYLCTYSLNGWESLPRK